ncbi:MAG: hypothetical protein HYW33_02715 [Candidatus Blackburnbacteria bacterium]|nr:hypothetical protein [Candidatus Blackburnbacteria bacterium]
MSMQTFFYYVFLVFGFFVFSFISWRKLREDYDVNLIFTLNLIFLLGGMSIGLVFARFLSASMWGFLLGSLIIGWYAAKKMDFKIFEILDGVILGLVWLSLFFEAGLLVQFGWGKYFTNTLYLLIPILVLFCARYVLAGYRRFSWYPSGKIGFIGGASGLLYFSLLLLVDFALGLMLSSSGKFIESGISFAVAFVFFIALYLRSGRRQAQRLLTAFQKKKRRKVFVNGG